MARRARRSDRPVVVDSIVAWDAPEVSGALKPRAFGVWLCTERTLYRVEMSG